MARILVLYQTGLGDMLALKRPETVWLTMEQAQEEKMDRKMCEICRIQPASAHVEIVDNGQRRKLAVCHIHRARLTGPSADELAAAAADRRLDAELADSFPASDPPSILRSGPTNS